MDITQDMAEIRQVHAAVRDCGMDAKELQYVEFDLQERTLSGYGYDWETLPRELGEHLPQGWAVRHAAISEVGFADHEELWLDLTDHFSFSNRMDIIASPELVEAIDQGKLLGVGPYEWGFTDERTLEDDAQYDPAPQEGLDVSYMATQPSGPVR